MKKILMLTAFALAGLAGAQDTTTPTETTTETTTQETTTTEAPAVAAPLTPAESFSRAQEFAVQADVAYPVSFYDRTLWKASVDSAYAAAIGEPANRDYSAYLAQLYTKTQWWINAYNAWEQLGELNDTEKEWASLSAAKLAFLALQRGDNDGARTYAEKGVSWKDSASLQGILNRLN